MEIQLYAFTMHFHVGGLCEVLRLTELAVNLLAPNTPLRCDCHVWQRNMVDNGLVNES